MKFIIFILSIIVAIKTISYGVFEIKKNSNKFGGSFVITLGVLGAILPNIAIYLKGI